MKLYAYAAAALALIAALTYGAHIYKKAGRVDAAEHALTDYKAAVLAREKQQAQAQRNAEVRSKTLATSLDAKAAELQTLRDHPPKASVHYVQLPGEECPRLRLDPEWVQQYNAASDASSLHHP